MSVSAARNQPSGPQLFIQGKSKSKSKSKRQGSRTGLRMLKPRKRRARPKLIDVGLAPGMKVGHFILRGRIRGSLKESPATRTKWRVTCTAGGHNCVGDLTVPQWYLTRENPKTHCGCLTSTLKSRNRKEYTAWNNMRTRVHCETHPAYAEYGGRGITICEEWDTLDGGFERFFEHIGKAPSPFHSVDRIDNDQGYKPGNVRWATASEQRANQRPRRYRNRGEKE